MLQGFDSKGIGETWFDIYAMLRSLSLRRKCGSTRFWFKVKAAFDILFSQDTTDCISCWENPNTASKATLVIIIAHASGISLLSKEGICLYTQSRIEYAWLSSKHFVPARDRGAMLTARNILYVVCG